MLKYVSKLDKKQRFSFYLLVVQYFASNQNSHHVSSSHDRSEDKDLMCIKQEPCESLFPKLQAVGTPRDEVYLFECSISEGDMAQEDVL